MMMSKERRMEDSERFLRDVGERRRRGGGDVFTIHYPRNNTLLGKSRLVFCRWHTHFSYKLRLKRATALASYPSPTWHSPRVKFRAPARAWGQAKHPYMRYLNFQLFLILR